MSQPAQTPVTSVADLIRATARARPAHRAFVHDDDVLSYAGLDALMDRVAAALQRDGVQPTQTIAICAASSIAHAAVYLGALRAGVAVAPLSPSSTPEALTLMLADAAPGVIFVDAAASRLLQATIAAPRVALGEGLPADVQAQPLHAWLAAPGAAPAPVQPQADWPFNIIYSSGTTGAPKGIVQPFAMRAAQLRGGSSTLTGYGPESVTLLSTPLYSNTTLVSFFSTLGNGGTVVLMAKFDALKYLELAQQHRVTHTMLVPVQYRRLLAHPDFDRHDLSAFQAKQSTSAPFSAALKAEVLRRWPGKLIESYGMTEGGGTCILQAHLHVDKLHTVGQPAAGHDIRLLDEAGNEVPRGALGEVVGRSPAMMTGYRNQPGKTADAEWFDAERRRYIRTGDVGRFDDDGFLVLVDRKKDLIISGGFNVYPSDLEAELLQHPQVAEASVVGVASTRWGETPVAFVTAREGSGELDAAALGEWLNRRVAKLQRVAAVETLAQLPRSPIGKVLKRELRDDFERRRGALD